MVEYSVQRGWYDYKLQNHSMALTTFNVWRWFRVITAACTQEIGLAHRFVYLWNASYTRKASRSYENKATRIIKVIVTVNSQFQYAWKLSESQCNRHWSTDQQRISASEEKGWMLVPILIKILFPINFFIVNRCNLSNLLESYNSYGTLASC